MKEKDAKMSIFSEAFMFGYGVFETLRTYDGKVFKLKEHVDRLANSARIIGFRLPYSKVETSKMVKKVAAKAYAVSGIDQRLKIVAIKGYLIISSIKLKIDSNVYRGVVCRSVKVSRPVPEAKTLAYLDSYLSHATAASMGAYEAILCGEKGEVYEGAYSNIFWFDGNVLCTRKGGVLPGITRGILVDFSPYNVKYKSISLNELKQKNEVFLTKTTTGIVPIIKIDGKKIGSGKVGEKTKKLMNLYNEYTKTH